MPEATRLGRELLPVFRRVSCVLDAVVIDACDLAARRHGLVRVTALPSFAAARWPRGLAARWPEIAILLVSGLAWPTEDQMPRGARFLRKPFTLKR